MSVNIKKVSSKKELRTFINYPNSLYKGVPWFVPKIFVDEVATLDKKKNPAFEFCDADYFLAYKDGKLVGRVAAIINTLANERWNHREVRFGWLDYIDDSEVSTALIQTVEQWGKERGMDTITGPLGFTDFDDEGMLVDGFDKISTMALRYTYPYYPKHVEALGFEKEADWIEYKINIPATIPDRIARISAIVQEKYGLRARKLTRKAIKKENLGHKIFDLVNETYKDLYNFTILPYTMIDKYVDSYLGVINLDYLTLVEDAEGNIVGFGITMPSIAKALQKCGGRLFPFGWWHLLKTLFIKHDQCLELLLIGVKPEFRNKGVVALIYNDLIPYFAKGGLTYAESNAELENNLQVQSSWEYFGYEQLKRRRAYTKKL